MAQEKRYQTLIRPLRNHTYRVSVASERCACIDSNHTDALHASLIAMEALYTRPLMRDAITMVVYHGHLQTDRGQSW